MDIKKLPAPLLVSVGWFSALTLLQFANGLWLATIMNVVLIVGLLHRRKWAFVLTLVISLLGLLAVLDKGTHSLVKVFIANGLVVVPMIMAKDFFFPPEEKRQPVVGGEESN